MTTFEMNLHESWSRVATRAVAVSGSIWAFLAALLVIVVWLLAGPIFDFSNSWQLVINSCTTIVTFLMVFLIQHGQTRDIRAIHLKLDELIRSAGGASNKLIDIEERSDRELREMDEKYRRIAKREKHDKSA